MGVCVVILGKRMRVSETSKEVLGKNLEYLYLKSVCKRPLPFDMTIF